MIKYDSILGIFIHKWMIKKDISDEQIHMQQVDPHNPTHVYVCFTSVHSDFGKLPNNGAKSYAFPHWVYFLL
jgi:hypothetical protein